MLRVVVGVLALALAACSSEASDGSPGAGAAGGSGGSGALSGAGGEAGLAGASGAAGSSTGGAAGVAGGGGTAGSSAGAGGLAGAGGDAGSSTGGTAGTGGDSGSGNGGSAGAGGSGGGAPDVCSPPSPCGPTSGGANCGVTCNTLPGCYGTGVAAWCADCGSKIALSNGDQSYVLPAKDCSSATQSMCSAGVTHEYSVPAGRCTRFTTSASSPSERFFSSSTTPCSNNECGTCIPQQETCLVVKGAVTVRLWSHKNAPAAWVRAETADDWAGAPCPYACP